MGCYVGLDVSLEMTSICVVAADGKVLREGKTLSEPEAVVAFLRGAGPSLQRVGLEAGALRWRWRRPASRWSVWRRGR
jgi:transposase